MEDNSSPQQPGNDYRAVDKNSFWKPESQFVPYEMPPHSMVKVYSDRWVEGMHSKLNDVNDWETQEVKPQQAFQTSNSDTNIAVAALFEMAARTNSNLEQVDDLSSSSGIKTEDNVFNRRFHRALKHKRKWNSKMTPEELKWAYLQRAEEEKRSMNYKQTARKRKGNIKKALDEQLSHKLDKVSFIETDYSDNWVDFQSSELKIATTPGLRSESEGSDVVEGTDSSGNGNGSSNDNNTGTGSGSGSNHRNSSKGQKRRSPALSTVEKNAEVDMWRHMNFTTEEKNNLSTSSGLSYGVKLSNLNSNEHSYPLSQSLMGSPDFNHGRKQSDLGVKCSPEERKEKLKRYRRKREERIFRKQVRYDVRKRLAESRPRVRGRFCKPSERITTEPEVQK